MRKTVLLLSLMAVALLFPSGVGLLNAVKPAEATFPGQNGKIAFTSNTAVNPGIYKMNPDGSGVQYLTIGGGADWSADGSKIAFARNGDIYSMNADGSNMTQLTNTSDWESSPTWSPDGSRIAYDRALPAGESQVLYKIHIMNANGSNQVPLQADPLVTHYNPSWSPNGSKIALIGIGSYGGEQMYTVKVNGTDLKRLTGPSTGGVVVAGDFYTRAQPNWSPDGSKILFARYGCGLQYCSEVNDYEVIVINADGSGRKRLTDNVFHDVSPVWSPNGRRIVFASDRDGDYEIWKMRTDGSSQTQLTFNTVSDGAPDWQPLP